MRGREQACTRARAHERARAPDVLPACPRPRRPAGRRSPVAVRWSPVAVRAAPDVEERRVRVDELEDEDLEDERLRERRVAPMVFPLVKVQRGRAEERVQRRDRDGVEPAREEGADGEAGDERAHVEDGERGDDAAERHHRECQEGGRLARAPAGRDRLERARRLEPEAEDVQVLLLDRHPVPCGRVHALLKLAAEAEPLRLRLLVVVHVPRVAQRRLAPLPHLKERRRPDDEHNAVERRHREVERQPRQVEAVDSHPKDSGHLRPRTCAARVPAGERAGLRSRGAGVESDSRASRRGTAAHRRAHTCSARV